MAKLRDDKIKWILSLDAKGVQSELVEISSKSDQLTKVNIKLNAELKETEKNLKEAEKAMEKLAQTGGTTSVEFQRAKVSFDQSSVSIQKIKKEIVDNKKKIDEYNSMTKEMVRTLKIEDMTMEQLEKTAKDLEKQLKKTSESTHPEAYIQLKGELDAVKGRMNELKKGTNESEKTMSSFSSKGVKFMAAIGVAVAAVVKGWRIFEGVMTSNRATGIEFKGTMDGINNALDYMQTALANLDFTNFIENLKEAHRVGREVSIMLEDIYDRENSFKLTSGPERAEIEELKTQLRDVNLTNEERLKIGAQIIERTNKLAEEERKIQEDRLEASKMLLVSQTGLTDAELEYMTVNRNANEQSIKDIKKIKELEEDLIHLRKNQETYKEYSNNGQNKHYEKLYNETTEKVEQYVSIMDKLKNKYGFSDPEQYELAYNATKKYYLADKEAVDNYVNSRVQLNDINIKTTKELRQTKRLIDSLTKNTRDGASGGTTPEQRQRTALNELNKKIETKHQEDLIKIKEDYQNKEIKTEAEFNRKINSLDIAAYAIRKEALEEFLKTPLDPKVRAEVEKQLADLDNKRLDKEIKLQKDLEKVLLDADPEEKERRAYEERLSALGLFGVDKEKLTSDQLKALELLEKQHQQNLNNIRKQDKDRETAQSEEDFENSFSQRKEQLQLELNELMTTQAATGRAGYEAEMEVHLKRLQMIQEEIAARKAAGLETGKLVQQLGRTEAQVTATIRKEFTQRRNEYTQYTMTIGAATGEFFSGQKSGLEAFGNSMIDVLFDVLFRIVDQKIMEASAVAIAEQAKAAAIAAAMPDSVLTFGASAAARTAAISAIIMGALQVAKSALKGMIGKKSSKNSDSSGSGAGGSSSSGNILVRRRFAEGGYNSPGIVGGYTGDGLRYEPAGVFSNGSVFDRGEYIVPQPVLKLPASIPYIRALEAMRQPYSTSNPLPKRFAEGGFNSYEDGLEILSGSNEAMSRLIRVLELLEGKDFTPYLGASQLQAQLDRLNKEKERFSQKNK